jgi:sigma-B regulation protein RsbU (phosphoserine phosphatase)
MDINSDNIALGIQTRLLRNFINLVRSSDEEGMLIATLQNTVDLSVEITGAETGSLFLLDKARIVTHCIMMRETPSREDSARLIGSVLDKGLAGWVVQHREVGLIHDTRHDKRWLDLPDQPYVVRSAIVTPILKGKSLFGILSLVHSQPDRFTDDTASLMMATADHIAIVLENAKLYDTLNKAFHQLEKAKETIETYSNALTSELEKGRHMQRTFLPEQMPDIPGWKIEACFYPAKQVSGDFYDLFQTDDQRLGIIIADVCDKGVSAALFMGIFRSLIHAYLEGADSGNSQIQIPRKYPDDSLQLTDKARGALAFLNHYILRHHGSEGIFATLFFGILHIPDGQLDYINAGHEPLMIVGKDGIRRDILPTGPAIGITPEAGFDLQSLRIDHGETLIGFTDGITDACINDGDRFGRTGVRKAIRRAGEADKDFLQTIIDDVFAHLSCCDLTDDIAMISISRL